MKKNIALISIIVPVHQVAAYLPQCLDSLLQQTYKNLEIILIDDGSDDGSGDICDNYAGKDSRIKVIHQEDKGVSNARNAGLALAKGDYIGFVDSDDWVLPEMFETLAAMLVKEQTGIAGCGFYYYMENGEARDHFDGMCPRVYTQKELMECLLRGEKPMRPCVLWNKLFRRGILEGRRFREDVVFMEDVLFLYYILKEETVSMAFCNQPLYYYRQREQSAVSSFGSGRLTSHIAAAEILAGTNLKESPYRGIYLKTYTDWTLDLLQRTASMGGAVYREDFMRIARALNRQYGKNMLCIGISLRTKLHLTLLRMSRQGYWNYLIHRKEGA